MGNVIAPVSDLGKEIHINNLLKSIRDRADKIEDIRSSAVRVKIEAVELKDGKKAVLIRADGEKEGFAVYEEDVEVGEITEEIIDNAIKSIVEKALAN